MRLSHILRGRRLHLGPVLFAALIAAPGVVHAQASAPDRVPSTAATPDRQRLRSELQRVNAEIDALKRNKRGLGDDYRLRGRMADAEALARRLMELDARGAAANHLGSGQTDAAWPAAPEARPSDDRADLESKADILSDQARRLDKQGNILGERVAALRGRQELRRRAGQLERDPFSPLEQAKRRMAISAASAGPEGATIPGPAAAGAGPKNDSAGNGTIPPTMVLTPGATTPGATTAGGPTPGPATPGGSAPVVGGVTDQTTRTTSISSTAGLNPPPTAIPMGTVAPADSPGSVALQFRGILDAATLAEIRRLEIPGSPGGNLQAMERALAALRARAAQLTASASALRTRAKAAR